MNLKLLALIVACMVVAGCTSKLFPSNDDCLSDSDCSGSLTCYSGHCGPPCAGRLDCGAFYCCDHGYPYLCGGSCYASVPTTTNCSASSYVTCH